MLRNIGEIYRKAKVEGWSVMSFEMKWHRMLYPFQDEMSAEEDEDRLDRLMAVRKEILFELLEYVEATGRLECPVAEGTFFDM